jgi:trehalose 6-phosphate phosphatase
LVISTEAGRAGWAALVADPARALIALDYDGTLAPIVTDPALAVPAVGARDVLRACAVTFGAVALISGRPTASLIALLDLDAADAPALTVLGLYGRQPWRPDEPPPVPTRAAPPTAARAELAALLRRAADPLRLEDKGESWAVHARGLPDPAAALARIRPDLVRLAGRHGLRVQPGRAVLELVTPGPDKGDALRLMADQVHARAVLWAGDDVADLAGFDALDQLRTRGVPGVGVAVANDEVSAPGQRADATVPDPAGLLGLLSRLIRAVGAP